jgi:A nuclease family of the HNH/ENDO VII superfamily with conserved AHH
VSDSPSLQTTPVNPATAVPATPLDPVTAAALGSPDDIAYTAPATSPQAALDETAIAAEQEDRTLDERALMTPPDPWRLLPIGAATTMLNWSQAYSQLEQLPPGAVALLPTIHSGWVKVKVGSSPTTSEFYVRLDPELMHPEPGSLAEPRSGPAPPPPDPLARVHLILDVMGLAPVLGTPADLANTVLYALEGDTGNMVLSGIGIIPGLGEATIAAKYGAMYGGALFIFTSRRTLRTVLRTTDGYDAHHIIPWELRYHPLVQAAAQARLFDMNSADNGISLLKRKTQPWPSAYNVTQPASNLKDELIEVTEEIKIVEGVHATHPAYNFYVLVRLEELLADVPLTPKGIIDPDAAADVLKNKLIPELVDALAEVIGPDIVVVNSHFKKLIIENGWLDLYRSYSLDPKLARYIHAIDPFLRR